MLRGMNTLFDVLHVVTAVFIVGPMAILPMSAMRAVRSRSGAQVASLAKSTTIFSWLSILVVVLGFAVMGTSDPKYGMSVTTPWVLWALILWLVAGVITLWFVVPAMKRAATSTTVASGNPYAVIAAGSGIASILLVGVVVLMVWKP